MQLVDVQYTKHAGVAHVVHDRPQRLNAFTYQSCESLVEALTDAAWDDSIGVIVLSGAGDKAFCVGSDVERKQDQLSNGRRGMTGSPVEMLHTIIRDAPKPLIAKVQGYAIGGGNVIASLCDLTIASERAIFGQVGPRVGSVDPGFGTAYLARIVGEKKAREMWYLCRRYTAQEAQAMGLVNEVVPHAELDAAVQRWCDEILGMSPTALTLAKRSFNVDTEALRAVGDLGKVGLRLFFDTEESKEGRAAFLEKRRPQFRKATSR